MDRDATSGRLTGITVAHYRVLELLGSGGMGEVYLADDSRLNRRVALKFLSENLSADDSFRARFIREARAIARINHPNIIHIYEVSQHEGLPFYVMEHVEGQTLRELIGPEGIPFADALHHALAICDGLSAAHQAGMVHRDIKPGNILLDSSGRIRILDFGLAKSATDIDITKVGTVAGTVAYMSPEQATGEELDFRSDIFSFGVVLREMLIGQNFFKHKSDYETLAAIIGEVCPPVHESVPGIPSALTAILDRVLAKNPNDRYQSVGEIARDLHDLGQPPPAHAEPATASPRKSSRVLIPLGVVALAAVAVVIWWGQRDSDPPAQPTPTREATQAVPAKDTTTVATTRDSTPPVTEDTVPATVTATTTDAPASTAAPVRHDTVPLMLTEPLVDPREAVFALLRDSVAQVRDAVETDDRDLAGFVSGARAEHGADSYRAAGQLDSALAALHGAVSFYRDAVAAGSARDTHLIQASIAGFWTALEQRDFDGLKEIFPQLPDAQEQIWRQFTNEARDLNFVPSIEELRTEKHTARSQVSVRMNFRDARGKRSQTLNYIVHLQETAGRWLIESMAAL